MATVTPTDLPEGRVAVVRSTPHHGTRARYLHRTLKCRCPVCTEANRRYMARYRRKIAVWQPRRFNELVR